MKPDLEKAARKAKELKETGAENIVKNAMGTARKDRGRNSRGNAAIRRTAETDPDRN